MCVGTCIFCKAFARLPEMGVGTDNGRDVELARAAGKLGRRSGGEAVRWWNLTSSEVRKGRKRGRARKWL